MGLGQTGKCNIIALDIRYVLVVGTGKRSCDELRIDSLLFLIVIP